MLMYHSYTALFTADYTSTTNKIFVLRKSCENEKTEIIKQIIELLKETIGTLQEASYVIIDEITASSWGYNGLTQAKRFNL